MASAGFGYLVLAHHWATMGAALAFGLVGAVVAHKLIRLRTSRMAPSEATLVAAQPVLAG